MRAVVKVRTCGSLLPSRKSVSRPVRSRMSCRLSDSTVSTTFSAELYDAIRGIQEFIPKLTTDLHKGQCGRIGVVGGSLEYTGAPYFAAMSSLKMGADLAYVFCCQEAAPVIKSYSPELIVHPVLDSEQVVSQIEPLLGRLHALVIGPGLGRDPGVLKNVGKIITHCSDNMDPSPPLIIDADGLFLINEDLSLITNYEGPLFLTPNAVEYNRLCSQLSMNDRFEVAKKLNAVIVQKGLMDAITNGINSEALGTSVYEATSFCEVVGSNRRCGGQGDILSGCLATFVAWLQSHLKESNFDSASIRRQSVKGEKERVMQYSLPALGACIVTKTASRLAFEEFGRGMTATDMILFISRAFRLYFGP